MNSWYILATKPVHRIEFEVMHRLHQQEYQALVPFEEKAIKVKGKRYPERVKFPLFPRYVFVCLQTNKIAHEHHRFKGTDGYDRRFAIDGVVGILGKRFPSGKDFEPFVIPDEDLAAIRDWAELGWRKDAVSVNIHKAFQKGTNVNILSGPFSGLHGKVDSVDRKRIGVLLKLFGSMRVLDFRASDLAVA